MEIRVSRDRIFLSRAREKERKDEAVIFLSPEREKISKRQKKIADNIKLKLFPFVAPTLLGWEIFFCVRRSDLLENKNGKMKEWKKSICKIKSSGASCLQNVSTELRCHFFCCFAD